MANVLNERQASLDTLGNQALLEHQILQLVASALRLCLHWETASVGFAKKLSSVRFTAQSFQRHLERLMSLEEGGGYMQFVRDRQPGLYDESQALRREHDGFRQSLARIVRCLEELPAEDLEALDDACHSLATLLDRLDQHHTREIDLIQEVVDRDTGGEG
jgi:hypothetical protein